MKKLFAFDNVIRLAGLGIGLLRAYRRHRLARRGRAIPASLAAPVDEPESVPLVPDGLIRPPLPENPAVRPQGMSLP